MSDSEVTTTTSIFMGSDGRSHSIFGPSSMELYLRCPRLWHYSTSYVPVVEVFNPHPMIGTLMHKAIAHAMTSVAKGTPWHGDCLGIESEFQQSLFHELEKVWEPNPKLELEGGRALLHKAIGTALTSLVLILKGKMIEAVEESLGAGTVDLVLRGPFGIEIWDHKWHEKQDPKWVDKELRKTETTSQFWDYAVEWMEAHEEPPALIGKHMIAGTPNKAWRYGVAVTEARLKRWQESRAKWMEQAQIDHFMAYEQAILPAMNFSSCWDFGQCPFFGTCHGDNPIPPETLWKKRPS